MPRELWTVAQAAAAMGVSEDTVRRLIKAEMLPAVNVSVRLTRIYPEDVAVYMESRRIRAAGLRQKNRPRRAREPNAGGINNSGYYPGMKVV